MKFDRWPWKTVRHIFCAMLSSVHHFKAIGEFKLMLQSGNPQFGSKSVFFVLCDLDDRYLTDDLEKNRAPLKCYFKLCASFRSHRCIQSGVTVRKRPSTIFVAMWPWNLMDDIEKQYGTYPKQHQALCMISSYVNSNLSYGPETVKFGLDLCDINLWPLTLTFCM